MPNLEEYWSHQKNKRYTRSGDQLIISGSDDAIPLINEIPRFCKIGYSRNFGDEWTEYPEDQFDDGDDEVYNNMNIAKDTLQEVFPVKLSELNKKRVLEAGSGNGRFTYIMLKNGAIVDTFDMSHAIDVLKKNLEKKNLWEKNIAAAQADIRYMPYQKKTYDFVVCLHVLQHTPSPEESIAKLWEMVKPGGALVIDHYRFILKSLYPPIGGFGNLFRHITLMLPYKLQKPFSDNFVKFWFPVHWYFKDSQFIQQLLLRISPVRFYYPWLGLPTKEAYYKKALLDTHDGSTDKYHHVRTVGQIRRCLLKLKEVDNCSVFKGGNGVLAWAYKRSIH